MKTNVSRLGWMILLLTIIISCQRDIDKTFPEQPLPLPPVEYVQSSIEGRITTINEQPVEGAVVISGNVRTTTDVNGNFKLTNITVDKNIAFVKVDKLGFFTGSRTISLAGKALNYIVIELIPKKLVASINATTGGNILVPSGGSIGLQANGFVNKQTNQPYSGKVSVYAFFLNPSAVNFSNIMPGALRAFTARNEEVFLKSFGMMAVELQGTDGEQLQLANDKPATIQFPISQGLYNDAPATIPLWFFDEEKGMWKEEGSATKQGRDYIGTVRHFSYWNVDQPYALAEFKLTVIDKNNKPLPGIKVDIRWKTDSVAITCRGFTDSTGTAMGKIPAGEKLYLIIYNQRNFPTYFLNFGPVNNLVDLGTINIDNKGADTVFFNGFLQSCNATVNNGNVFVLANGTSYSANVLSGSNFRDTVPMLLNGPAMVQIYGIDHNTNVSSDTVDVYVKDYLSTNFILLNACNDPAFQHFAFTHFSEGSSSTLSSTFNAKRNGQNTSIHYVSTGRIPNLIVDFDFDSNEEKGTYTLNNLFIDRGNGMTFHKTNNINIKITEWDRNGKYIKGHFSGLVNDSTSRTTVSSANFRMQYR